MGKRSKMFKKTMPLFFFLKYFILSKVKEYLNNEKNVVNLKFTHKYLNEGLGIHTFSDIDGE